MHETILQLTHPLYYSAYPDWQFWRDTFEGGRSYRDKYLKAFEDEQPDAFERRKSMTPVPAFAKAAILEIRNAIFQRLADVSRAGGSDLFQDAIQGQREGVDLDGSSMDSFMGIDVLTDLLVIGKVGVYVDSTPQTSETLADAISRPYLYTYPVEDILSWTPVDRGMSGQFKAVLLRDRTLSYTSPLGLGVELPTSQ